jgi:hypothetical protein
VQTWAPNGAYCQQWKIEDVGNGYYRLLARNSNKALTVDINSDSEGANVLQQDWSGAEGQQWSIVAAEEVITRTEENAEAQFSVFPNPTKSTLIISRNSSSGVIDEVTLIDLLSRKIYHEVVSTEDEQRILNTSDIPAGIYLLRIKSSQKEFSTKVTIEK